MGGSGATDAIRGYNDNDITSSLVNGKHANPAIFAVKPSPVKSKAPSKVWNYPKGTPLTL